MENFVEISSLPKTGKQSVRLGNQNGGTVPGAAPALYVLVKQSTGKSDQGNLVSNQDDCGLPSSAAQPVSKARTYLPAECTSGNVTVILDNSNMWNEFYHRNTEMVLTKQGRRMFPYCRYWVRGLESNLRYILVMDISPVDNFRYKWNGNNWEPSGKAEPHVLGRVFIHPESPSTGYYWMRQPVSFYKLKVTNNTLDQEGHIILHSMHRYLPRLHLVPAEQATDVIQLNGPDVHTFTFPQTEFFAVTAYQNIQITQLKIDYNPFAKGFRDDGLSSRLQRDTKQNDRSEQEGGSLTNSPSNYKHPSEGDILDPEQRALETSFHDMYNPDLERDSPSPYHDSPGFMETDIHGCDVPSLKQETSESPMASPCQSIACVASLLQSNGDISAVVKEEPEDDYDYGPNVSVEGISVKQEDEDDMSEEYLNSSDSFLEQQLKDHKKEIESHKRPHDSQLGVARAKMLKLDSAKMPVVYLEPCAVTRNTVKVSTIPPATVSSKSEQSSLNHSVGSFPTYFENSFIPSQFAGMKAKEITTGKQISGDNVSQMCSLVGDMLWENTEISSNFAEASKVSSCNVKTYAYSDPLLKKVNSTGKKINALENISCKNVICNKNVELPAPRKRGRPRKIKHLRVGRPPKSTGRLITTSAYASLGPDGNHLNVKPDLVDVDGVLFVSFASKEALDIHSVNRAEEKQLKNVQTASLTSCDHCVDPVNREAYVGDKMIQQLEKELLEDLKSLKYRQVIHPSLREVGLKLNFVDAAMSIDLKYLGVQLPLSYSDDYISWKNLRGSSTSSDAGLPFVSRTGKTNDFTKIKGWRGKLHSSSKTEGILIESSLKNRSAFCSDKLDEYLENEGKLLETSMGLSPSTSVSPVVYQLPTKSTSYVRTLDSVLKKQSTVTTSSSCTLKSLSVPYVSKKKRQKLKNRKNAVSGSKEKSPAKSVISVGKEKSNLSNLEDKITKSQRSRRVNEVEALMVPTIEENMQGKHITVHQPQQSSRLPSLSKTQLKLMDLEDCALWDGKPRTYITEERADLSLTTLLTAQASLKNKPIYKIMKRRAPPCNNDFCRLGCICSSLSLEKRQPVHCRKPDCMFGCTCLKRKVVLVKEGSKKKKILEKPLQGKHMLHGGKKVDQQEQDIEKEKEEEKLNGKDKRKEKIQYTFCDREPEKTVKNFPLWVKVDGELDPEPVYIPTSSDVEATKPVTPPSLEVLPSDDKPPASEVKLVTGGVKPSRVYTPRPNPVIREEDKDPVYLYFESMMTCARIRVYTRKVQEKKQHQKCPPSSDEQIEKEHPPEVQPTKIEKDKEPGGRSPILNLVSNSLVKNSGLSCSAENASTSYVHHTTPDGITKLVEIISDCKWEEDRNEILNILSEHMKNKLPKSLEVGNFVIDLESESKTCDEKNIPIYSSRVKISMLSSKNKSEKAQIAVSEPPDNSLSTCKKTETKIPLTPAMLREKRKKGLPFYANLSPAGKLLVYPRKSGWSRSTLVQVNGKNYPQARLLLGQMGALHPASRLAAYLTGRLRPSMLDLSTISTVISKEASNTKVSASESKSAEVPTSETSKIIRLNNTALNSTVTSPNTHVSTQRQIAIRPLLDGVTSQLFMNAVGALQQKIPGIITPQPLTGPQKFSIRSTSLSLETTTITTANAATVAMASLPLTTTNPTQCNKAIYSPSIYIANATEKPENSTASAATSAVTVKVITSCGIATPVATTAFAKSTAPLSTSLSTASSTTGSIATVSTSTSPSGSVGSGSSGIHKSTLSNEKSGDMSPPSFSPGGEKRMGPRLLLIPVNPGSPTLRPQNMQLGQGKRMILQPIRNPGGNNLYRHPNGQIIQLVPLHQLQTTGSQPSLSPVMFRNSGSVVGIRLPTPAKPPETSVCPSSSDSAVTPVTTTAPVFSAIPTFSQFTTTETTSVLPGTSTNTSMSSLPSTISNEDPSSCLSPAVVSTSSTIDTALSMPSTSDTSSLSISSSPMLVASTAEGLSVVSVPSTSDAPLPPPIVSTSSPTEALSALSKQPTTESFAVLSAPSTTDTPFMLPTADAHSILPKSATTEGSSTLPVFPTSQDTSTLPGSAATEKMAALGVPSVADVPVVLAVSSSATPVLCNTEVISSLSTSTKNCTVKATTSVPACSISATQTTPAISSVFVPVTGTLSLRISPSGIKSIPIQMSSDSKIKYSCSGQPNSTGNLSLQSNSFALLQFPRKNIPSSNVKQVAHIEIKNDMFNAIKLNENVACSQVTGNVEPKENKRAASQPESCSKYVKCDQNGAILERSNKYAEINLKLSKNAAVSSDPTYVCGNKKYEEKEVTIKSTHVKTPEDTEDKVSHSFETETECGSQTVLNSTKKVKLLCETQGPVQLQRNMKEKDNSVAAEKKREEWREKPKVNSVKAHDNATSHHRKVSSPIIDITVDDSEKEEKTDDSADEMADELSDYQSEDVNVETMDESESSGVEDNVDIETVEELKEKFNIARLKSIAAHVAQSKQLHPVRDSSAQTTASVDKLSESSNKKPKNTEKVFASYRQTHTANERRRRKEMRGLFETLKETLGLQSFPKVSKCFLLKQAFDEIQGLTDQADKLKGQKDLLMRKQETLIRKVSTLSGKTQEVVLKKLEYIYAKQKAVEEQKTKQHKQEKPTAVCETTETAKPSVEDNSSSSVKDMKSVIVSTRRTKPLILSRKGSYVTGDTSSHMTLTNASLVMTANGQVLALKNPLVSGQFASFPLQTKPKSEIDSTNGTTQQGVASVMIQLPSSTVPVQVKGIFPAATLPIALSSVASHTATAIVQKAPELPSENEDSFMMPRIVNVTSLATKEDTSLNPDINKNSSVMLQADSQESEPSFQAVSQDQHQASSRKVQNATGTAQDFLGRKSCFPQIVSVSSLKGSSASFTTEVNVEQFSGIKKRVKLTGKGNDCQMSNNSIFQKLQVPRNSGLETELQKVASAIHEPALDANDLIDVENDDTDETLTSLLNEIAFLNQQLNDDISDMSELPNSLSSGFSLKDMESRQESATAGASSFQFGAVDRSFKDPSVGRESSGSITPLLLHLSDDDLPEGNRNSGEAPVQSDTLIMLGSEVKNSHTDLRTVNRDGSRKNVNSMTRTRSVSPPILQMKTNLEASTTDMAWRPMPKLAPLGLKTVTFSLDSEGHNTKMMPLLAPVAAKEMKTTEPISGPNLDPKAVLMLTPAAKKSK
nr:PREDICTED: MAX gene-associated protein isoform X2 [Anolis carolinensis]|eukprot:XP_008102517.1 PREDICTED: MAX gene-associated protein isoform X2 [Anolis carolinensis]